MDTAIRRCKPKRHKQKQSQILVLVVLPK
uniref:Uncharacterized protein n=1 Tax=Rhizophora mucronata TaxID=61149 RepID=A0A2P2MB85_RHIMU